MQILAPVPVKNSSRGGDVRLPGVMPNDLTTLKRNSLPGTEVPVGSLRADLDVHPFVKVPVFLKHLGELGIGAQTPSVLVGPSESGGMQVIKGHDTLLATRTLGIPGIKVSQAASSPGETIGASALSHFLPSDGTGVPAWLAMDENREMPRTVRRIFSPR